MGETDQNSDGISLAWCICQAKVDLFTPNYKKIGSVNDLSGIVRKEGIRQEWTENICKLFICNVSICYVNICKTISTQI